MGYALCSEIINYGIHNYFFFGVCCFAQCTYIRCIMHQSVFENWINYLECVVDVDLNKKMQKTIEFIVFKNYLLWDLR